MMSSSSVGIALISLTALFAIAVGTMAEDGVSTRDGCDKCYTTDEEMCIRDCDGREDGVYQSCRGCSVFAYCSNGRMEDCNPCPGDRLQWDDYSKRCEYASETCICYPNPRGDLFKVLDIGTMGQMSKKKETTQGRLAWARIWRKL